MGFSNTSTTRALASKIVPKLEADLGTPSATATATAPLTGTVAPSTIKTTPTPITPATSSPAASTVATSTPTTAPITTRTTTPTATTTPTVAASTTPVKTTTAIPATSTPTVAPPAAVQTPTGLSTNKTPARMQVDYVPEAMNQTNPEDIQRQWNEASIGEIGNTTEDGTTLSTRKRRGGKVSTVLGF